MPDLAQYQTVFRVAKPNAPKRGQGSKRKQQSSGSEQDGGLNDDDNVSRAQARLQKLEEMVIMLMQSNQDTSVRNGQPTPPSAENSTDSKATSMVPIVVAPSSPSKAALAAPVAASAGHLDVSGTEKRYLGATHWAAILENVCFSFVYTSTGLFLISCRSKTYKNVSRLRL